MDGSSVDPVVVKTLEKLQRWFEFCSLAIRDKTIGIFLEAGRSRFSVPLCRRRKTMVTVVAFSDSIIPHTRQPVHGSLLYSSLGKARREKTTPIACLRRKSGIVRSISDQWGVR